MGWTRNDLPNTTQKPKYWAIQTPQNPGKGWRMLVLQKEGNFCSTSGTRRVFLVKIPVVNGEMNLACDYDKGIYI